MNLPYSPARLHLSVISVSQGLHVADVNIYKSTCCGNDLCTAAYPTLLLLPVFANQPSFVLNLACRDR